MTRGVLMAALLMILVSVAVQEAHCQSATTAISQQTTALSLHKMAVLDISKGKSLDAPLSSNIQKRFSHEWTLSADGAAAGPVHPATYREAISHTENFLQTSGERVTVKIRAKPGRCNVKYWPVVGQGLHLDAGTTDLEKSLTPRWYTFSCDCTLPPLLQQVDTSTDTTVSFACDASGATKSN